MTRMKYLALLTGAAFLTCIVVANWLTTHHGLIPVGFGLTATAGTYVAGLTFVVRDSVQDAGGRRLVLSLIVLGAFLSYAVAVWVFPADETFLPPAVSAASIALASGIAFALSEYADYRVYSPLRDRGYIRAAAASNVVGSIIDTFLFLWIAGFAFSTSVVSGQLLAKLTITAAVAGLVLAVRASRKPVTA